MIKICTQCYFRNNPNTGTGPKIKANAVGLVIGLAFLVLFFFVPLPSGLGNAAPALGIGLPILAILGSLLYGRSEVCSSCGAAKSLVPEDTPRGRALAAEAQRHAVPTPPPAVPPV